MNKGLRFIPVLLSLLFLLATAALGQRTAGNIEGTVTDPNGAVVVGATVTATSTGTTAAYHQTVTTDPKGYYQFSQVPSGTYTVTATSNGFKTVKADVTVVVD